MTTNHEFVCGYDGLTCERPRKIIRPRTFEDLVVALCDGDHRRTLRAGGWSLDGQSTTTDALIELSGLDDTLTVGGRTFPTRSVRLHQDAEGYGFATVGPCVTWRALCRATLAQGLLPASVPTGPDITVIGALSTDCVSRFSHAWGPTFTHVASIDVLLPNGALRTGVSPRSSDEGDRALFRAAIGGLGLVGVILSATLRLRRVGSVTPASGADPWLRAETFPLKFKEGVRTSEAAAWWRSVLTKLHTDGEQARLRRERVGHRGWRALPDGSANENPMYDAQSIAGYFTREAMGAVQYASRFVDDGQRGQPEFALYAGLTATRFVGEWALSQPKWHETVQHVFTGCLDATRTYRNRVDPFLFFMEANARLRGSVRGDRSALAWREILQSPQPWSALRFNGHAQGIADEGTETADVPDELLRWALDGLEARFDPTAPDGTKGPRADAAPDNPRLYALQQTHVLHDVEHAVNFLIAAHEGLREMNLEDRATLFDLLYLPGDANAPFLSIAGARGGFAVTIGWQEILQHPEEMQEEQQFAEELATLAVANGGKVSLSKNVYARGETLQGSFDEGMLDAFRAVKNQVDPDGRLANAFSDAFLSRA